MCNSIFLGDKTLTKAEDGEEVEVTIKGVYHTDEDGIRKIDVLKVDGKDVADADDCGCGEEDEDPFSHTGEDALRIFLIKGKKG